MFSRQIFEIELTCVRSRQIVQIAGESGGVLLNAVGVNHYPALGSFNGRPLSAVNEGSGDLVRRPMERSAPAIVTVEDACPHRCVVTQRLAMRSRGRLSGSSTCSPSLNSVRYHGCVWALINLFSKHKLSRANMICGSAALGDLPAGLSKPTERCVCM